MERRPIGVFDWDKYAELHRHYAGIHSPAKFIETLSSMGRGPTVQTVIQRSGNASRRRLEVITDVEGGRAVVVYDRELEVPRSKAVRRIFRSDTPAAVEERQVVVRRVFARKGYLADGRDHLIAEDRDLDPADGALADEVGSINTPLDDRRILLTATPDEISAVEAAIANKIK